MGKPRGKATDPCINAMGSLTLGQQLRRKADEHVPTRVEDSLPCRHFGSTPTSMSALRRNPQVPASTTHEVLGPGTDWRGIPRDPSQLACRLAFPEARRSGPCGPHGNSRATCWNSQKSRRFSAPGEMRLRCLEASHTFPL